MTDRMQTVQGRCPACGWTSLFLADGGHVTCARIECPDPSAADDLLHGEHVAATPRELELRQRSAWINAGRCPKCGHDDTDGRLCNGCASVVRAMRPRERREWRRYEPFATSRPIQSHGYTPAGLLGIDIEPAPTAATDAPDTITDPAWLREQYAVVIRRWWDADDNGAAEIAEAVLAVRDRHLDQLRQRLQVADGLHQEQLAAKDQPDA